MAKVKKVMFGELLEMVKTNDGLVLLGCGGDLMDWVNRITGTLKREEIAPSDFEWKDTITVTTTGGRCDLVLLGLDGLNISKLAMWRLDFGKASWLTDYVVNYAGQH